MLKPLESKHLFAIFGCVLILCVAIGWLFKDNLVKQYLILTGQRSEDSAYGYFEALGPMNIPRDNPSGAVLPDGRLLLAMGVKPNRWKYYFPQEQYWIKQSEYFDPRTKTFSLGPSMHEIHWDALDYHPNGIELPNGKFFFAGYPGKHAELYNPVTNEFELSGEMKIPRTNFQAVLLDNGKLMIIGGARWVKNPLPKNKITNNTVVEGTRCNTEHCQLTLKNIEYYDYKTGQFTLGSEFTSYWHGKPIKLLNRNYLIKTKDSYILYDQRKNQWIKPKSLYSGKIFSGQGALLPNGNVLFHHSDSNFETQPDLVYNVKTNTFEAINNQGTSLINRTVVTLNANHFMYIGGTTQGFITNPLYTAEIFDLYKAAFVEIPAIKIKGELIPVYKLKNGEIFIASPPTLSSAQALFIPKTLP
jgi:hypothetical protein